MTYVLSKLFWVVLRPLNLTIFLLVTGLLFRILPTGWKKLHLAGAGMVGLSGVMVVLFGFTNLPDFMIYKLENQATFAMLPQKPAGIIVLGGGFKSGITRFRNIDFAFDTGGDRLIVGFQLSNRYPGVPLIYSGGPPERTELRDPETKVAQNIAKALYGEGKSIIVENRSRNTWENAVYLKELLNPNPQDRWIIVTSAFHATRTSAIFKRNGFNFVIAPADFRVIFNGRFELVSNAVEQFAKTDLVLKELAGIIAYTLMGRIDWPF